MIEMLSFEFVQNALIAGILVSLISGIIGSLIVVNRMVFLAGGIAHTSYGGIGIAVYFSLPIFLGASIFSILAAYLIAQISLNNKKDINTLIALVWATGMAIGILLIDLTPGYNVDLLSYLFGSILAVSSDDIKFIFILFVVILFIVSIWYKDILAVSYDTQYARLRGINVRFFYTLILILSALAIVVAIKIVGLILVIALLTIPVYMAQDISDSLFSMMTISGILSSIFTVSGLILSYNYDLTSGATIIIVSAVSLIVYTLIKAFKQRLYKD